MGRLKIVKNGMNKGSGGLRHRWLRNTAWVVCAIGLVCATAVTAAFAAYYYTDMDSDLRYRVGATTDFLTEYNVQSYDECYRSCVSYTKSYEDQDGQELQFFNAEGQLVASSNEQRTESSPATPEIQDAVTTRGPAP